MAADMYLLALERLETAGYRQYEISNVARDGCFAWHNVKYWTDGAWLGFGPGAHGTRDGVRSRNVTGVEAYIEAVRHGAAPRADLRPLSREEALGDAMMMGLRLAGGVDLAALGRRYGCDIMARFGDALGPAREAGLLRLEGERMRLTREGMLLANEVLAVFV
jgi:oxygen-independent coproporphyrinogen-3 oxidase